jgi:two-component system, NtrC family, sensor kinase
MSEAIDLHNKQTSYYSLNLSKKNLFLNRLSVGGKITAGYFIALGIAVSGIVLGLLVAEHSHHRASELAKAIHYESELMHQLQAAVLQARTHQQQLIPLIESPSDFRSEYSHVLTHEKRIQQLWNELKQFSETYANDPALNNPELNSFLLEHRDTPERYLQQVNRLVGETDLESLDSDDKITDAQDKILRFTNSSLALSFDQISDDLVGLLDQAHELSEAAVSEVERADRMRTWLIAISLISSLALAAIMAMLVSRAIIRPLQDLTTTAKQITSESNFDLQVPVSTRDEIGVVATSVNQLIARVKALLQENETRTQNLVETNEKLVSTQAQMIAQEKLASLGALTAGIAHEIKNPLNFVNNFAELSVDLVDELMEELEGYKTQIDAEIIEEIADIVDTLKANVSKIEYHGKRADKIVANMLMHSRSGQGSWEQVNLNELVAEAINLAYHGMRAKHSDFNLAFDNDYDSSLEPIKASPQDLNRVFLNIASNACYAIHKRQLAADESFKPLLKIRTQNKGDQIEIRIRDNGTGMSAEVREKVFDQFFTTKPTGEGTGLGLSLSYSIIVEQHKGSLNVESESGVYTDFIVTLPKDTARSRDR